MPVWMNAWMNKWMTEQTKERMNLHNYNTNQSREASINFDEWMNESKS